MRGWPYLGIAIALAVADTAAAQPGNAPIAPPPPPPPGYAPAPPPVTGPIAGEKSESTALALSLGGTIASIGLMAIGESQNNDDLGAIGGIGVWVAPSFGHWYSGKLWTNGMTLRLAGAGAVVVGAVMLIGCIDSENSCEDGPAVVLFVGGAGAFVAGGVYDIVTAPRSAREHNESLRLRAAGGWAITPVVTHDRAGLVFGGRF